MGEELVRGGDRRLRLLVAAARDPLRLVARLRDGLEVREDELGRDRLDVGDRVERARATWTMSLSSKQRTTWTIASTSRMCWRNLLPRPSPFDAPRTRPAMSTNSIAAGTIFVVFAIFASGARRASGTDHDADVRLDRAEGIVRRLRLAGAGEGVEERGLADVRQSDDSGAQHWGGECTRGVAAGRRRVTARGRMGSGTFLIAPRVPWIRSRRRSHRCPRTGELLRGREGRAAISTATDGQSRSGRTWSPASSRRWHLNRSLQQSALAHPDSPHDDRWRVVGTADFDGDGKTDLLLRDRVTGTLGIWYMDGLRHIRGVNLPDHPEKPWRVAATGDFDGDGRADIVWFNPATGMISIWFFSGGNTRSVVTLRGAVDDPWFPVGAGDFDGDGSTDLLWRNAKTGSMGIWIMKGVKRVSGVDLKPMPDPAWEVVGAADFEGNGRSGIFWRNATTGENALWKVTADGHVEPVQLPPVEPSAWEPVGPR